MFCDGFLLDASFWQRDSDLRSYLLGKEIEVNVRPGMARPPYKFVQHSDGPMDIHHLHSRLGTSVRDLRRRYIERGLGDQDVILPQFDVTRDVGGCFWVQDDWRQKHEALKKALQNEFQTVLRNNGNSHESCFQFEERARPDRPSMRIKIYNKIMSLLQSESVKKAVGMNTNLLYYPSAHMQKTLQEFKYEGVTRIEISYNSDSV